MARLMSPMCRDCRTERRYGRRHRCEGCNAKYETAMKAANAIICRERQRGSIPPASALLCRDCGLQARDYDHRDYGAPLKVEPVCRRCNVLRGPADYPGRITPHPALTGA